MEELGIIIDQNGNSMNFGKWRPREIRQNDNPNDWHDDSFLEMIYHTEWFQSLGIPYDLKKKFHNQLDLFAKCGIVVVVNNKEDGKGSIVLVSPNSITLEQIQVLLDKKTDLINFENGNFSFIDVFDVDEDYTILENFYHITDYYNYLENLLIEKKETKK